MKAIFYSGVKEFYPFPHVLYDVTLHYKSEGRGFDSRWGHCNFALTYAFRPHYVTGISSASNRNEYQEYLLGVKAAGV
jgi:hypothetical protein